MDYSGKMLAKEELEEPAVPCSIPSCPNIASFFNNVDDIHLCNYHYKSLLHKPHKLAIALKYGTNINCRAFTGYSRGKGAPSMRSIVIRAKDWKIGTGLIG